ncbi:hypothetical protein M378DRAFT_172574 [Amanita muscaria Koide BX008]|uniref:Uncharacterized protein n=1 Tax=Amanita muscaria (strain Koide BX008) TaxID=946122 RepID=A0A0C2WIV3_AMAMK|nr:hypothetical protein M378DRAFT_172574 [Amanita muscaria Koide BX008]
MASRFPGGRLPYRRRHGYNSCPISTFKKTQTLLTRRIVHTVKTGNHQSRYSMGMFDSSS